MNVLNDVRQASIHPGHAGFKATGFLKRLPGPCLSSSVSLVVKQFDVLVLTEAGTPVGLHSL